MSSNCRKTDYNGRISQKIAKGKGPQSLLAACQEAIKIVGNRFEKQEYFLPELIACGEMLKKVSEILKPGLAAGGIKSGAGNSRRKIVGTVRGDVHDIGKDIVALMLDVNGFKIRDLGVDVPEEAFVAAVKEMQPQMVALSGILTLVP